MNLSEAKVIKLDKVYIYLIKLGNNDVIYYKLPLYVPGEFNGREELYKVATLVDESHTSLSDMFSDCLYLATINGITEWDTSNVTDMANMFFGCTSLKSLDLSNFDTSNVTNMIGMFNSCHSLESIDLSSFNNTSNVADISWMFYSCDNLTELNLSNFDTSNVTIMSYMFEYCNKLRTLRLDNCSKDTITKIITSEGFPTGKINETTRKIYCKEENAAGLIRPDGWEFVDVTLYEVGKFANNEEITEVATTVNHTCTDLSNMFYWCSNLTTVNTTEWDTSNVTTMANMFYRCIKLISLDLDNFDTSNVTDMSGMVEACDLLNTLSIANFDTSKVTNMRNMFHNCHSLTSLDLSNWDASKVENMSKMFDSCDSLQTLNLSGWDMTNVTNVENMFNGCSSLHTLRLDNCSNDTISKIITSSNLPTETINGATRKIYCQRANTTGLTAPNGWTFVDVTPYKVGEFKNNKEITEVSTTVIELHTDLSYMFYGCTALTTVNTADWNTSNVTNMSYMFYNCKNLTSLDLSSFDTSKVADMRWMFLGCDNLAELDLSNWDTNNVTNMSRMFYNCAKLHTLRLNNCNNDTISKIITSVDFPTGTVEGATRTIYCKEENVAGLTKPENWVFIDYETEDVIE